MNKTRSVFPRSTAEAMAMLAVQRRNEELDLQHEADVRATGAGQLAAELRAEGVARAHRGDHRAAILYFQMAVAQLVADPESVASVAARHDLAKALSDDPFGHPGNLSAVRDLLEHVVFSAARQRFPRRWASSASILASSLRALSAREPDEAERARMLDRAEELLRKAIEASEEACSWLEAAAYWFNLGNLNRERGDTDEAIDAYERARECLMPYPDAEPTMTRVLVSLSSLRRARGRTGDKARSRSMLKAASRSEGPDGAKARLALAEIALEERKVPLAASYLKAIDLGSLPAEAITPAVRLYEKASLWPEVIAKLESRVGQLLALRSQTVADLPADRIAADLQWCSLILAELYMRREQAVQAFLALDNASALRFSEVTSRPDPALEDEVSRRLRLDFEHHGSIAAFLEDILDRLRVLPVDNWRDVIREWAFEFAAPDADESTPIATVVRVLRTTTVHEQFDLGPLVRELDEARLKASEARIRLAEHAPSLAFGPVDQDLDQAQLQTILSASPGTVFIRLALFQRRDLAAVSVFLKDGRVAGRQLVQPFPRELLPVLEDFSRRPGRASVAGSLSTLLETIDLSPLLGDASYRAAVLLPSSMLSRLPLAALGPPGHRLIDRVESISWLPNLFPLRVPEQSRASRQGSLVFVPGQRGRTGWHDVAVSHLLDGERVLRGGAADPEAVRMHARTAETVTFYAHGRYVDGQEAAIADRTPGPSIELADGKQLRLDSLLDQWWGASRVELWGCETGVHLPMDPMAAMVDDAFGFDYEFLRVGVRAAIGSLYPVLEPVTATLVARYRQQLGQGASAPHALAHAQRSWVQKDMPRMLELLREDPKEGLARFAAEIGGMLAPGARRGGDPVVMETMLSCPVVWASFRHVGIGW